MRTVPVLMALGAIGLSLGGEAATAQGDFEWSGRLARGQTLEIRGINGAVIASAAEGNEARVTAVKREGRRGDPDDVRIEVVEHGDGVTICAVYPSRRGENTCEPGGGRNQDNERNDTEVRFRVQVPAGVHFSGNTVNGDVEARDLRADAHLRTVNGDIDVSTSGQVEASTVNGGITASIGQATWDGTLSFHTVNGSIELMLPAGLAADVSAETVNGAMHTDFPLTVQGRWGPRRLSGRIGNGGGQLQLKTVNGSIRLIER